MTEEFEKTKIQLSSSEKNKFEVVAEMEVFKNQSTDSMNTSKLEMSQYKTQIEEYEMRMSEISMSK